MIITDLSQGTPEWLEWRRKRLTASDIPSILGDADFSTPLDVWKVKTGRAQEKESNFVMTRGTEKEPMVRALYALENDMDAPPVLVEHDTYPWLAASLDGYNGAYEGGLVVEIKYPGKEKHEMAQRGEIPECYRAQVQVQLACANAKTCHYVSFNGEQIAVATVERDDAYLASIIPKLMDFWSQVLTDTPPPLSDRDFLTLEDKDSRVIFEEWRAAKLVMMQIEDMDAIPKEAMESAKKRLEIARVMISKRMPHPKVLCNGVKAITVKRKSGPSLDIRFMEA